MLFERTSGSISVMRATDALEEFKRYAAARQHDLSRVTGSDVLDLMVGFYRDVRAEGCDPQQDADMLLFQYGTHDWGKGEHFEFDVARQLFLPGAEPNAEGVIEDADDDIWQLHLTLQLAPTPELRALGSYDGWCHTPQDVDEFVDTIRRSAAYGVLQGHSDADVLIYFECAG